MGPILLLLYVNDLPDYLQKDVRLFADDTSILFSHKPREDITQEMNEVLNRLKKWSEDWMVDLNPEKTKCMLVNQAINFLKSRPVMGNEELEFADCHKHLGVILNSKCTWLQHVDMILDKANRRLGVLRGLKYRLNGDSLRKIYISHIRSVLEYANVVWNNRGEILSERIDKVQNDAARIITGLPVYCRSDILLREASLEALKIRRERAVLVVFF